MIITYEGQDYPFDFDDITVKQAIKIEKHMGCSLAEWGERLAPKTGAAGEPDPDASIDLQALQALGWLILFDGRGIPVEEADFKINRLAEALNAVMAADAEKAGPTAGEGNGQPAGGTPVLSPPSSATASQ